MEQCEVTLEFLREKVQGSKRRRQGPDSALCAMLILRYKVLEEHWRTEGGTEALKDSNSENDGGVSSRKVELMAIRTRSQLRRTLHL